MVRAAQPDIVPPGWQLQLIDMLAHGDGGVELAAPARGGAPHEGRNNRLHVAHSVFTTLSRVAVMELGAWLQMLPELHAALLSGSDAARSQQQPGPPSHRPPTSWGQTDPGGLKF